MSRRSDHQLEFFQKLEWRGVSARCVINTDIRDIIEKIGLSRGECINGEPVIKRIATWKEIKSALTQLKRRNVTFL